MICKILFVEMFFSNFFVSSQERPGTGFAVFSFGCQSVGMKVQRRQLARVDDRLARKRWDGRNESCTSITNTPVYKTTHWLQSRRGQDVNFRGGETCSPPTGELDLLPFFSLSLPGSLASWLDFPEPRPHPRQTRERIVSFSSAPRGGRSTDGHA